MPPSGFNNSQTKQLTKFFTKCGHEIEKEAAEKGMSPSEILRLELAKIDWFLTQKNPTISQKSILILLKDMYGVILAKEPIEWNHFWAMWKAYSDSFEVEIESIVVVDLDVENVFSVAS